MKTHEKMAIRTDNIMTFVSISSDMNKAGANEYMVSFSGIFDVLLTFMLYVFVELHR